MSFKNRLTLFFMIIVIVPMTVTTILLIRTSGQLSHSRTDTVLSEDLSAANNFYNDQRNRLEAKTEDLSQNKDLQAVWSKLKNPLELKSFLTPYVGENSADFSSIHAYSANGKLLWKLGADENLGGIRLQLDGRSRVKYIDLSVISPERFVREASRLTDSRFIISSLSDGHTLASSFRPGEEENYIQKSMRINIQGLDRDEGLQMTALIPKPNSSPLNSQPVLAALMIILFLLAIAVAAILQKSMRDQVSGMVTAARKISDGDFDVEVPTKGNDEMSALAYEINQMSGRLKEHIHNLEDKSDQLENSIRRFGEIMGSTLDQPRLLQITLDAAVELCLSTYGQLNYFTEDEHKKLQVKRENKLTVDKPLPEEIEKLFDTMERSMPEDGEVVSYEKDHYKAIGAIIPLQDKKTVAMISLARENTIYRDSENDILQYITQSASLSLNNISMHDQLIVASITDDLTGLSNKARFQETLDKEVSRAKRFDHSLALIMADIDDFKQLNDTYGHLEGDNVLIEVGRAIKKAAREVDEPSRWGGEEFSILLPETDANQAFEVAERIRESVESLELDNMGVTLSLGVATLNHSANGENLIRRADEALYESKRAGKNRTTIGSNE